jgi:O-antigen/teichoic acid export membrane protein
VGLAGVGVIALASSLLVFSQRVDGLVSRTIYPAVCAVKDRTELLLETFVKSNRVALMWGLPFGFGLLLFSPALVEFILGEQWEPAVALLQALGLVVGFGQFGFNWTIFFQATGETRPLAVSGVITLIAFALTTVPLMIAFGLDGYIAGTAIGVVVQLATRTFYLRRMFPRFNPVRHLVRAIVPCIPPVLAVVALRLAFGAPDELAGAIAEFAVFVALTIASTAIAERRLLAELSGYVRGRSNARRGEALASTA